MKILSLVIFFFSTHSMVYATCNPDEKNHSTLNTEMKSTYGENFERAENVVQIETALANYPRFSGQDVQLLAEVTSVCQTKGCWMALKSTSPEGVRVRFKDYGFFVPVTLVGKKVLVKGSLERKEISEKLARHFKEDAGASAEEIESIQGSVYEYTFTASGVQVL